MREQEKRQLQSLLNHVATITRANEQILDATGSRFNMFSICGVDHYENTHSAIIAELLNPEGTHGLKSKLLECFIETLGYDFKINPFNCAKARVYTEHSTSGGRIDILIEDDCGKAIIIENKIYANDQTEQLKRYDNFAKTKYQAKNYQILYLTLFGDMASLQSGENVDYLPISHDQTIIRWLEQCVAIASRFPIIRETIIQYINHLKKLTNQDMDTKNREEITAILLNNLRAAQAINQNYSNVFTSIAEKHFNPKMEDYAKKNGLVYHFEKCGEGYIIFHLTNPLWLGKIWIKFTIEGNRCFYGLVNDFNNYCVSEDNRKLLYERLTQSGNTSFKKSNWWPFYIYSPNLSIDNWENDIINSENYFKDCKEKIKQILDVIKGIDF